MTDSTQYEIFVYEKAKKFFEGSRVEHDAHIVGNESGISRQIDVAVWIEGDQGELLYIFQCKDRKTRPADIIVLGEFSSVIQDVRAAKGYLVCTSGFAKSNHQYARTKGIELVTFEDLQSERWNVEIEIPVLYTKNIVKYGLQSSFVVNKQLADKNKSDIELSGDDLAFVSEDGGVTPISFGDHLDTVIADASFDIQDGGKLNLIRSNLHIKIADIWVEAENFVFEISLHPKHFLVYRTPSEYSQLTDHLRGTTLPLTLHMSQIPIEIDRNAIELDDGPAPVFAGLSLSIDLMPNTFRGFKPLESLTAFKID